MREDLDPHYKLIIRQTWRGDLIPFLGAGANACGRPKKAKFEPGGRYLPTGKDLALQLVEEFGCPKGVDPEDLVRVAEYLALNLDEGPLRQYLRELFDADYPPTPLHELLARLPSLLREKGFPSPGQLIVTTNYDDMLERTFKAAGEPFDLVTYISVEEGRGKFLHVPFDGHEYGEGAIIQDPQNYWEIRLGPDDNLVRPAILKLHGWVDRLRPPGDPRDTFVITEDHYIAYPLPSNLSSWVPAALASELRQSNFLFLGYSLRDWNMRVILHRIWGEQPFGSEFGSWAIQLDPDELEKKFWAKRSVQILEIDLTDYVAGLNSSFEALPSRVALRT